MASTLLPHEAAKFIAKESLDVTVCPEGVTKTATRIFNFIKSDKEVLSNRWKLHVLQPVTEDKAAVDWVFLTDVINFSFWSEDENRKFTIHYKDRDWTGYWSMCAALNRAIDKGIPITDPTFYSTISREQLSEIFRSDSDQSMPMLDERLQCLHEAGKILVDKYNGSFVNMIKKCDRSAQKLMKLLVSEISSFQDEVQFKGKTVGIYKRAQILIADTWACCQGKGLGEFSDIDTLTMFADYRIPQALLWLGALQYSDHLMEFLNQKSLMKTGDRLEVEIRGCSIWATELIVDEVRQLIASADDVANDTKVNAVNIDHFLWDFRQEHAQETADVPFHRIRCIYY